VADDQNFQCWLELQRTTIAVVKNDRLILDDTSRLGLHRKHIIRRGELPDPAWLECALKEHPDATHFYFMDTHEIGHLYIVWKDQEGR
jgi:hypothetical protein